MEDPGEKLSSLGRVCSYRADFDRAQAAVELISEAYDGFQAQFEEKQTTEERALFALDVVQMMLLVSRERAGDCIGQHEDIACENLDMFDLLGDWVAYTRTHVADSAHCVTGSTTEDGCSES